MPSTTIAAALLLCLAPAGALGSHSTLVEGAPAPAMVEFWAEPAPARD